jgi:hypothetical protein
MNTIFIREIQYLMSTENEGVIIAEEVIISKIYNIRGNLSPNPSPSSKQKPTRR